jgi:hypothetical protein
MEEKKVKTTKVSKLNPEVEEKKMSYEDLTSVVDKLQNENYQLKLILQRSQREDIYKRMDYLFKIIENSVMFSEDFLAKCTDEIVKAMTIPEDTDTEKETEEK